jgi:uncharacterized protein YjbI with pentapeptide repeats
MSEQTFTIKRRPGWGQDIVVAGASTVREAVVKSRANLSGADLSRAYLSGAYLSGAYLSRADLSGAMVYGEKITRLLTSANRMDGHTFFAFALEAGGVKIMAGCRWFTVAEFRAHVAAEYPDTDKAAETLDLLAFIEARAKSLGVALETETA